MNISNRFRIMFLLFVVLGVYYPTIFAGINSVDDYTMFIKLDDLGRIDWKGLFMPGGGYYYRPLLMLSFFADKWLWDLSESFMHLENILIHAVNTILVFFIAVRFFARFDSKKLELPLLSALLFALHPINTEAVVWISGRTDPLASVFVLFSMVFLLKGLDENRNGYLYLSSAFALTGCMAKEVAVFFLPAACLIALYWPKDDCEGVSRASLAKAQQLSILLVPFVLGGASYFGWRFLAFRTNDTMIQRLFKLNASELLNNLRIVFKVFGFYVKKLFFPFPLNFAIIKFNNNYVWLGIAVFLLLILLAFRRHIITGFLLSASILITPAILVALLRVAWTPVAERYLYLPSAFFAIGIVGAIYLLLERIKKPLWITTVMVLVLIPATFCTAQRNILWQDNQALYQDTLDKSPDFVIIHNELAIALMDKGKSAEADMQLEAGKKMDPNKYNVLLYVNQARLKLQTGHIDEARGLLLQTFNDKESANSEVLKMLARIDEKKLFTAKNNNERNAIYREILDTHEHLYPKSGDPVSLYRGGQMALLLGDKKKAVEYFEKAYNAAPEGTYYKPAAKTLAEKLKR